MKKVFTILLLCLILIVFSGCTISKKQKITDLPNSETYQGIHSINKELTDKKITDGGQSSYVILLPNNYSKKLFQAASEIKLFINLASGTSLKIVTLDEYKEGNYITFINPDQFIEDYKDDTSILKTNGYKIKTINNNVYIISNNECGALNGAYGFLENTIDFKCYAYDEFTYDINDVLLYEFNIVDVPDIEYRVGDVTAKIDGDTSYRMRLKYNYNDDVFAYVNGTLYHNSLYYFPVSQYNNEHYQNIYSETNGTIDYIQLCYSAHGDNLLLEEMLDIASDQIITALKESNAENVTFMQSDSPTWCNCDSCAEQKAMYGTDAAVMIKFLNRLVDKVDSKLEDNGLINRKYNIIFFAYQKTEKAPVKEINGEFVPIDSSVVLRDNIYVFYAPIYAYYNESFEGENNYSYAETLKAWNSISKECFVWFYQTNFSHYLYPYNSLPTMQERYNYIALQGAKFVFDQNQWDQGCKTSFHYLKSWMSAKLAWDVSLDYNKCINDYFEHYFYDASDSMKQLYDEITLHMEQLKNDSDMTGDIYFKINQQQYFSKPLLDHWLDLIEVSYDVIEKYKEVDATLYEKLYRRICIESMSIRYMLIELYEGRYSPEKLKEMQNEFMLDCFKYGIDKVAEITDISTVFEQWGLI